jgi:hypothetical protein
MRRAGTGACPYDAKVSILVEGYLQYWLKGVYNSGWRVATIVVGE